MPIQTIMFTQIDNTNISGQLTLAYKIFEKINAYGMYATGSKPVGLNLRSCCQAQVIQVTMPQYLATPEPMA